MFQTMDEVRRKTGAGAIHRVIEIIFFCTLFALPWINQIRAATFLFLLLGGITIISGLLNINYSGYRKQLLFIICALYFLLQAVAFTWYPDEGNTTALQQKAALIAIPLLLYVLTSNYENIWHTGVAGFLSGNIVAAFCCVAFAMYRYLHTHNTAVFFYHEYAGITGLSAIYLSFYLLIALGYIVLNKQAFPARATRAAGIFLYVNLLLLSSKIAIISGSLLLLLIIFRTLRTNTQKIILLGTASCIFIILTFTANPIKKRFADVNITNYTAVPTKADFKDYRFDGLSLRLVFWRLGYELINEKKCWIAGDGGAHYHQDMRDKKNAYHLYAGQPGTTNTGYQNYNMHNQYMETYLQFGIIGIGLLLLLLLHVLYNAIRYKHTILIYATTLFAIVFLTESVLETQSGILLFTIILSGEWILLQKKKSAIAI